MKRMLTIIVPAYNEARTVAVVLERLARIELPGGFERELVVVDDGSTDATWQAIADFAARHAALRLTALRHARNRGKGRAIRTALARAGGEYVIVQDADLECHPEDVGRLLAFALERGAPVVYGTRFARRGVRQRLPAAFWWGNRLLSWLANRLYGQHITDEATCYKLVRTDLLRRLDLQCEGFEFCPEVTAKLSRLGLHIAELPVAYTPRSRAEGKKLRLTDGWQAIATLWRWRHWREADPDGR